MDREQAVGEAIVNIVGDVEFVVLWRGVRGRTSAVSSMTPDRVADFLTVELATLDRKSRFRVRRHEVET